MLGLEARRERLPLCGAVGVWDGEIVRSSPGDLREQSRGRLNGRPDPALGELLLAALGLAELGPCRRESWVAYVSTVLGKIKSDSDDREGRKTECVRCGLSGACQRDDWENEQSQLRASLLNWPVIAKTSWVR